MALFAFMGLLGACAKDIAPYPPESALPSTHEVVVGLTERRLKARSFIMQGEMELVTPTDELYGDHLIQGLFPDKLRAEVIGPFGRPVLRLVCDGERMIALDYRANLAYAGRATRDNLARFLGLRLSPAEIYALLVGSPAFPETLAWQVSPDQESPGAKLLLKSPGGAPAGYLLFDPRNFTISRAMLDNWLMGESLTCEFSDFVVGLETGFPKKILIADRKGRKITLDNQEIAINQPSAPRSFDLDLPSGVEVRLLQ